jgi:hypothetical protein
MVARAAIPGFLTVKGAAEPLGLAPRSVRGLIYAGRLPSVRLGRVHFLHVADVEAERRRRLGLPLPARPARPRRERRPRPPRAETDTPRRQPADQSVRRQRAAERAESLERWLHAGHQAASPTVPFEVVTSETAATCDACGRSLPPNTRVVRAAAAPDRPPAVLCLICGRRAVLNWADERRREATAARRLAADVRFVPMA